MTEPIDLLRCRLKSLPFNLLQLPARRRAYRFVAVAAILVSAGFSPRPSIAQNCPTEQSAKRGFVVERGEKQQSDIFHGDGGVVHTIMRFNGVPLLETTRYEGLFELDRLEEGRRTKFEPRTNLKMLFPLKPSGGLVDSYEALWQNLADKGAEVEIRGDCASACTLVMSYIPKERLCFDADGLLLFHMATQVSRDGLKNPRRCAD